MEEKVSALDERVRQLTDEKEELTKKCKDLEKDLEEAKNAYSPKPTSSVPPPPPPPPVPPPPPLQPVGESGASQENDPLRQAAILSAPAWRLFG